MSGLKGKVAVVTGGNSGIGYAVAKELAEQGATVVITGRRKEAVENAAAELGVVGVVSDQSNLDDIEDLRDYVRSNYSGVDILVINAGVAVFSPIEQASEAEFDLIMDVNFKGAYFTLNKFHSILKDGASVIYVSSINATTGMPGSSVYSASKAAVNSLVRVASIELAQRGIRVNAISPGPVFTPILEKLIPDEDKLKSFVNNMQDSIPLKRIGLADEVAKLTAFLAGDDALFITGSDYVIDGGATVNTVRKSSHASVAVNQS